MRVLRGYYEGITRVLRGGVELRGIVSVINTYPELQDFIALWTLSAPPAPVLQVLYPHQPGFTPRKPNPNPNPNPKPNPKKPPPHPAGLQLY